MFDIRRKARSNAVSLKLLALFLALSLFAPQLFARFNPKPASPNFFSLQQEVQAGQQAAAEVDKTMPIVADAELNRYIQSLGARLVAVAPGPKYPFTFKIVNQKEINAFALPGGPIHVNLGTIQAADNEAQLAGVMAHEMGHVIMRHSTHMASQQMVGQLGLGVLGALIGRGTGSQIAQAAGSFGLNSVFMKYSRDAENQADLIGTDIMHDAGYDPQQLVAFFRKLEEQGGAQGPQFFSDHPNPGNRAQNVGTEAATLSQVSYRTDSQQFQQIKSRVGGMKAYTAQQIADMQKRGINPNSGQVQPAGTAGGQNNNPSASGNYQTLNHRDFDIQYPANWQAYGDENSEVTIAPQNGIVQDAIAYGVIISGYQPEDRGNSNWFADGTQQIIDQLRQSNPNMRQTSRVENFKLNGANAKSIMMMGTSPLQDQQGRAARERDWLITIQENDGTMLYLVFIAPDQEFNQLQPDFNRMLKSLRVK